MSLQTDTGIVSSTPVEWAPVPRVNLLPPEILEARAFSQVQRILAGAVGGVVVLVGVGFFWTQSRVDAAEEKLAVAQARTAQLRTEQGQYDDVPATLARVAAAQQAREAAMATDVTWYRFLNDVALSTPRSVWLSSIDAGVAGDSAAAADPLAPVGIGRLAFAGKSTSYETAATLLESFDRMAGLDGTSVQVLSKEAAAPHLITFTGSSVLTQDLLSHRFDRKAS